MIHTSSESDRKRRMILKYQAKSPSIDEHSCEGSFLGGDGSLKKGPWTSAEDAILVDYIKKHGEGNWNAVQKHTGLSRCGKSCRLRWTNHLRPDLKKGAFTSDEEQLIIKLHAKLGNRWAKMAAHLPGRTDNEIKNYWNTRIKKLQRAGLPLYPPNIQSLNENQSQCGSEFALHDKLDNELFQPCRYHTDDAIFDNFKVNQKPLSYTQLFPDISVSTMLKQGFGSENYDIIFPTVNHTSFPSFHGNGTYCLPSLEQLYPSEMIHQPLGIDFPYDPDPGSENRAPVVGVISGSHALPNGNFSTSQTIPVAVKLELPSLQYPETDLSSWLMSPPTPPLEAVDALVESPLSVSVRSDCVSTRNSGLLEALLHEAQAKASAENKLTRKNLTSSTTMMSNRGESSALNLHNMDWRDCGDPRSPLGCSVFSAYTSTSISSLEESSPGNTSDDQDRERGNSQIDLSHRDALPGSDWCHNVSDVHKTMGDTIAELLDELCDEYLNVPLDPHP